jgi:tRNA pseudouridine(38-40) synthase
VSPANPHRRSRSQRIPPSDLAFDPSRQGERTVQATLAAALQEIAGSAVGVPGAGRTDAGVHAGGQVAAATLETRLDPATLQRAINAHLPRDVAVVDCALARDLFDPRLYPDHHQQGRRRVAGRPKPATRCSPPRSSTACSTAATCSISGRSYRLRELERATGASARS